jgi:hypothetical protein
MNKIVDNFVHNLFISIKKVFFVFFKKKMVGRKLPPCGTYQGYEQQTAGQRAHPMDIFETYEH